MSGPLFSLGQVVATPPALNLMERCRIKPETLLARHMTGDWGEIDPDDAGENERALQYGDRLLSVYKAGASTIWIITEADRSSTTILLPSDY